VGEVVYTKGGERYIPNYIENRLKFSAYIKDAAVLGAGRDDLTALICIDGGAVGHWAEENGVTYTSYAELSQRLEVSDLIEKTVKHVNDLLPIALGIVLIFKSSGVANLAQGAMAMVGGYLTWAALTLLVAPLWTAVPLALLAMYFLGRGIERVALRPMIGQPAIMVIMLTLGLE